MRNKMSKLLSVLLTLVMLLSLAGPLAPSARAEGPYKVSLDAMEHGTVTRSAETAAAGDTITLTPVPDTGYILNLFAVYTTDYMHTVDITASGDGFVFTMPAEDVHVLATFKVPNATYTVTFDPNGGEGTMEPQTFTDGETWTIPECAFTPPEGKVFDSWLISPVTGTQPHFPHVGNPGSGLGFDFDAIAQAQWKDAPVTHTVKFAINLGDPLVVTPPAQTVADGEKATEPSPAPEAFGCTFLGWYLGEQKYDFNTPVTGDITLEAKWDIGPEYYYHGIVVAYGTADRYSARIGTVITITANEPAEGKVFDKWVVEGGGITLDDEYSKVTTFEMKLSTVAVKATFKDAPAATCTVTLIAYDKTNGTEQAGGEVAFSDSGKGTRISGDYEGNSSRTVGVYPASDYSFAGWAKGSPSGEIVSTSSPYTFTVTEDVTLYALFEKITTYPVWVGGVQVTSANKDDILGDGKAKYDPDSKTLTLDNPTISGPTTQTGVIYAEIDELTITGKATLNLGNAVPNGIEVAGNLIISGAGTDITATGGGNGILAKNITISGGTVNATGCNFGVYADSVFGGNVTISGGSVTAKATGSDSVRYGINGNTVSITGGTVTATSTQYAIGGTDISISGGTVTATGDRYGISQSHEFSITGGTLEATGIEVRAFDFSSITVGEGLDVLVNTEASASGATAWNGTDPLGGQNTVIFKYVKIEPGAEKYPVWVGGVQVTSANKDDILGDGTASFDPATNTLTLDGLNVGDGYHASGASIVSTGIDLTVKGSATLSGGGYGIYVIKTTEGGGNLTLDGAAITYAVSSGSDTGIRADGNISISGGTIDVTAAKNGIRAGGSLIISGGTVNATGGEYGIRAGGSLTISGGTVNATGGEYGISAKNAVSVSGGTVTAVATMTDSNYYSAVHGQSIMITGGTVSAKTARGKAIYAYSGNVEISADVTAVSEAGSAVEAWYGSIVLSGGTIVAQGTTRALDADNSTKINNGITKVTLDGDPAVYESVPDSVLIGDALIIEEPEGGMLDDDKTTILESDGTTKAKHVVIVPGTTEKFPVEVVITTHDKDGNVISTVGGTATADKTEVAKGDTITVTVTPNPGFELESIEFSDGVTGGYQAGTETSSTVPNDFTTSTGKLQIDVLFKETAPAPTTYNVTVHAVDEASAALAGAKLQLLKDGSVLDEWTSTSSAHIISGLVAGDYTIHEVEAPEGYKTTADQAFSIMDADVEVIMAHARTEVSILSVDESESPLAGAYLQILDPADLIVDEWSAGTAPHVILGLKTETTYKIHEKTTPTGYTAPADQTFVIAADGTVTYSGETNSSEDMLVKHEPIGCTVTFETNGGSAVASQTVNSGEKATKPADPTKSGFVFDGWYADATFAAAFDFDTPVTADVTVYAKWTEESKPGEIVYTIVSGGNSTWTKGSSSGVTIVVKRDPNDEECFSHFASVQIGGTTLASGTDYTAVAGSTVITLNASALQKLTTGTKTVTINFDDGKATTSLIIKAGSSGTSGGTSPKTGDNSNPGLWITVMVLSGLGLGGLVVTDKKRRYVSRH